MTRDLSRDSAMHDSIAARESSRESSRDAPSSSFKFRSGMALDMPMGGYRNNDYEEDETITKRRRIASQVSNSGKSRNVTWEEEARQDGLHQMVQQLLLQNQRMEEKLSRFERLEEKLDRMDRIEGRLVRVENKMDEILRLCR